MTNLQANQTNSILDYHRYKTCTEIAKLIGTTEKEVRWKLQQLGLKEFIPQPPKPKPQPSRLLQPPKTYITGRLKALHRLTRDGYDWRQMPDGTIVVTRPEPPAKSYPVVEQLYTTLYKLKFIDHHTK